MIKSILWDLCELFSSSACLFRLWLGLWIQKNLCLPVQQGGGAPLWEGQSADQDSLHWENSPLEGSCLRTFRVWWFWCYSWFLNDYDHDVEANPPGDMDAGRTEVKMGWGLNQLSLQPPQAKPSQEHLAKTIFCINSNDFNMHGEF